MLKPFLTCLGLGLGLMTVSATALAEAQAQPQTPMKPPGRSAKEDVGPSRAGRDAIAVDDTADPRCSSQTLMQRSLQRSLPIGAAHLLNQSAETDLAKTKTSRLPSVALTGTGDQLPAPAGMSAVLARLPHLTEPQQDILLAPDVAQVDAQAKAQRSHAESVLSRQRPGVNLLATGSSAAGGARSTAWTGGVSATTRLIYRGAEPTLMAAHRRPQAVLRYRDEAIEAKRYRLPEMHEAATSALDRARRVVEILRNSDRIRASTLQQWQYPDHRLIFDLMGAEGDYYTNRNAHLNALFNAQQVVARTWAMGRGVALALR